MVSLDKFYSYVRPSVPGCPIQYVDDAIRDVIADFCTKTLVWQEEYVCGDIMAGEHTYSFNPWSAEVAIVEPLVVMIAEDTDDPDNPVKVRSRVLKTNEQDLDTFDPYWRETKSEIPTKFYMDTPSTIRLIGTPTRDIPNGLHLRVALKSTPETTEVPDYLYMDWADTIANGVLAKLHAIPGKVWSNPQIVNFCTAKYRTGISRARSKVAKSYVTQSKSMLPKVFAGSFQRNWF